MKLLLISNSTNAGEEYLRYPLAQIAQHLQGVKEVAFVPYAGVTFSYDEYEAKVQARFNEIGIRVHSVHHDACPAQTIAAAEAIVVGSSRKMVFEAKKVIVPRPDISDSAADVLEEPILVCKASGTCVVPVKCQRNKK